MTTPVIIGKLEAELNKGIETEAQVVYLLVQIRKLIEREELEQYSELKFYCDWALHSSMDRAAAKAILKQFDAAHALLCENDVELYALPAPLRTEIDRISQMRSFKEELTKFLAAYGLPPLTLHRSDGWIHFLHLYSKIIEDIPLVVRAPEHISQVIVQCETARETIKHEDGEIVLFRLTWIIYDKNGQSGVISVYNTFADRKPPLT